MAIGIPKMSNNGKTASVRLEYEKKRPISSILETPSPAVCTLHTASSRNELYFGDNLLLLQYLLKEKQLKGRVSLIYIDPPFATQSTFVSRKQKKAYSDSLTGSDFIEFLRERLILLHELLSPQGSIYLHLDDKMIFEMKLIMDEVFGSSNYRNLIVRKKCNPKNYTRKAYGNIADLILFYTKSDKYIWDRPVEPLSKDSAKEYRYVEPETSRRFMKVPIHAPGTRNGETGKPWRGMMPPPGKHWQYPPATLDKMDARGEIFWSKNGNPRRKVYLDQHPGAGVQDIWLDFKDAHNQNIKITGYPTEKNPDLLRRIIQASSHPGDLVLDCFAGSGTTLAVADELQRNWIGIDNSIEAITTILDRFSHGLKPMGDYVKKSKKEDSDNQPTLFDSLFLDTHKAPSTSNLPHNSIVDFSISAIENKKVEVQKIVNDWLQKSGLLKNVHMPTQQINESSDFGSICYHLHERDKRLGEIINKVGPCSLHPQTLHFEFLVGSIISQQLSRQTADTIFHRFRSLFNSSPVTPRRFLKQPPDKILATGVSRRKYSYISDLSERIVRRDIDLDKVSSMTEDQIRSVLKTVKGIGDWTVNMFLIFGIARQDVFPIQDLALRKTISQVYDIAMDDIEEMQEIGNQWKPFRSIASWYMYKYGNEFAQRRSSENEI
jgi:adenine-specific DNA-methyltransferase